MVCKREKQTTGWFSVVASLFVIGKSFVFAACTIIIQVRPLSSVLQPFVRFLITRVQTRRFTCSL